MGLVRSNFPQTTQIDLSIAWGGAMEKTREAQYNDIVEVVETTSSSKIEVFYGARPNMQRFRGERQPREFREYKQFLTNDEWEYTHTVKRSTLDDIQDPAKYLRTQVENLGPVVDRTKQKEVFVQLRNGVSVTGYDGKQFFDFFHTFKDSTGRISGPTQSNMNLGGSALDTTTIRLVGEHFANLQDDQGEAWEGRLTHVLVREGSQNHHSAREIANAQFTVQANTVKGQFAPNTLQGSFDIITTHYGIGTSEWMAFDLSDAEFRPLKVLSHSVSGGFNDPEFEIQTEGSYESFWKREWAFGVYNRWDVNPGYWQTAYLQGSSDYTYTAPDLERQKIVAPNSI